MSAALCPLTGLILLCGVTTDRVDFFHPLCGRSAVRSSLVMLTSAEKTRSSRSSVMFHFETWCVKWLLLNSAHGFHGSLRCIQILLYFEGEKKLSRFALIAWVFCFSIRCYSRWFLASEVTASSAETTLVEFSFILSFSFPNFLLEVGISLHLTVGRFQQRLREAFLYYYE